MTVSKETAKKMNKMREDGMTLTEIAAHFGIKDTQIVRYHTKKEYREDVRKRAKAWDKKNPEKKKKSFKLWIKNNQKKHDASTCLSMIRKCLRTGSLTKETLIKETDNFEAKKQ